MEKKEKCGVMASVIKFGVGYWEGWCYLEGRPTPGKKPTRAEFSNQADAERFADSRRVVKPFVKFTVRPV